VLACSWPKDSLGLGATGSSPPSVVGVSLEIGMAEIRDFSTAIIASLSTGITLCEFSEIGDAAEFLLGHPIWSHHLSDETICSDIKRMIAEQCPGMPADLQNVSTENYRDHIVRLEREFGKTVKIRKGSGLTAMLPTDGIAQSLEEEPPSTTSAFGLLRRI
jgi:hypothetical protein